MQIQLIGNCSLVRVRYHPTILCFECLCSRFRCLRPWYSFAIRESGDTSTHVWQGGVSTLFPDLAIKNVLTIWPILLTHFTALVKSPIWKRKTRPTGWSGCVTLDRFSENSWIMSRHKRFWLYSNRCTVCDTCLFFPQYQNRTISQSQINSKRPKVGVIKIE